MKSPHIPVLLDEVVEAFKDIPDGFFVDCTLGYAGHGSALLEAYGRLRLVGIDRDEEALRFSKERLAPFGDRVRLIRGAFSEVYPKLDVSPIVGVLADLGVSSLQLDKKERGFAFDSEELDMRMDRSGTLRAYEVINGYDRDRLARIFETYGEVRGAGRLADAIVAERTKEPITTAARLSRIVSRTLPSKGSLHPATLPFQAIRIEVNDELGEIERLLEAIEARHDQGMTVAFITFHSLEDRLVKQRFKRWTRRCVCPSYVPRCECGGDHALGRILTKKPITATAEEVKRNPRSRSAKLRIFRFDKEKSRD